MMRFIETNDGGLIGVKVCKDALTGVDQDKQIFAIVSTEAEDSDGDIIYQGKNKRGAGWDLTRFNKSPLLTWQHDTWWPNLSMPDTRAKVAKHEQLGRVLMLDPAVFDVEEERGAMIDGKLRRGSLTEWSVGFKGRIFDPRRKDDGSESGSYEFFEQLLMETAVANRGSNEQTETMLKSMLGRTSVAADVQKAGDAEAHELADEIAEVNRNLELLEKTIIELGERITACESNADVIEELRSERAKRNEAVAAMYRRLANIGTAHG